MHGLRRLEKIAIIMFALNFTVWVVLIMNGLIETGLGYDYDIDAASTIWGFMKEFDINGAIAE